MYTERKSNLTNIYFAIFIFKNLLMGIKNGKDTNIRFVALIRSRFEERIKNIERFSTRYT